MTTAPAKDPNRDALAALKLVVGIRSVAQTMVHSADWSE